jgi:FkbM family methyltransferase
LPVPQKLKLLAKDALYRSGLRINSFGQNLHEDIRFHLPNFQILTAFDVGANHGQSARILREKYASARIFCFEPNPDLAPHFANLGVALYSIALGERVGTIGFDRSAASSDLYSVTDKATGETVVVDTVDHFCEEHSVLQIDYLKIDTEGHDLSVVRGADQMLTSQRVGMLQAEVGMNVDNTFHVPFFEMHRTLQAKGYWLFGVYEQYYEWTKSLPYLRRSNVVYISQDVASRNKRGWQ